MSNLILFFHLAAAIFWMGGMAFMVLSLRPAVAAQLQPPQRLALSLLTTIRSSGASGWRAFFAVTLPLSRPALVVGITLAMMEVVNDLGAVQYFGVNSLTAVMGPLITTPLLVMVSDLPQGHWAIGAPLYCGALLQAMALFFAWTHFRRMAAQPSRAAVATPGTP